MKIPGSIRNLYQSKREVYKTLQNNVDQKVTMRKDPRWHYESRVKDEQSFALKIETGRCDDLQMIEDFFACTIVVKNQNEINRATGLVDDCNFKLKYQRPKSPKLTFKNPESFPFDDLRLYVEWQDDPILRPTNVHGFLFEVQIKTYLQHAWAIVTHDLVYKSDSVSWPKQRIAYQVKAMLEHAEVAISKADELSDSVNIRKTDKRTRKVSALINLINSFWDAGQLPDDLTRLARNILSLINALEIDYRTLKKILEEEAKEGRGPNILNLSPYGTIVQSIFRREPDRVKGFLVSPKGKFRILVTREMDVPDDILALGSPSLILVN